MQNKSISVVKITGTGASLLENHIEVKFAVSNEFAQISLQGSLHIDKRLVTGYEQAHKLICDKLNFTTFLESKPFI